MLLKFLSSLLFFTVIANANTKYADVIKVTTSGKHSSYRFAVTLKSNETGCKQYANWWEILFEDGTLLYRRILIHSHPNTQPFTRSSSIVTVDSKQKLYIRAHMNTTSYGGSVFEGNIQNGFHKAKNPPIFPKGLDLQEPLPTTCLY